MRTLLTAIRGDKRTEQDAEPIIVDTDTAGAVVLELNDGERLALDATELRAALNQAA